MENKEVIQKIKKLKKINPRSKWMVLNRDFLLQEIKAEAQTASVSLGIQEYSQVVVRFFGQRIFEPAVIILLLLGVFLGSSLVVNAAFYSLPGDSLYRVKIALEKTQVVITPGEEKKLELKMEFAKKRVEEFDKIVQQTNITPEVRKEKINLVVGEFKKNVVAVREYINNEPTSSEDKEKTLQMAIAISSQTDELARALDETTNNLTEVEKVEIEEIVAEAVASAQETSLSAQELIEDSAEEEVIDEGEAVEIDEEAKGEIETTEEEGTEPVIETTQTVDEPEAESELLETTQDIIE